MKVLRATKRANDENNILNEFLLIIQVASIILFWLYFILFTFLWLFSIPEMIEWNFSDIENWRNAFLFLFSLPLSLHIVASIQLWPVWLVKSKNSISLTSYTIIKKLLDAWIENEWWKKNRTKTKNLISPWCVCTSAVCDFHFKRLFIR